MHIVRRTQVVRSVVIHTSRRSAHDKATQLALLGGYRPLVLFSINYTFAIFFIEGPTLLVTFLLVGCWVWNEGSVEHRTARAPQGGNPA